MGLFSKKPNDSHDDLTLPDSTLADVAAVPVPTESRKPRQLADPAEPPPPPAQAAPAPAPASGSPDYGVDDLLLLMRQLPKENVELVVRVLKKTLESLSVSVPGLVQAAADRERELEGRIAGQRRAIAALEEEIESKKRAIAELEKTYGEVTTVKEQLNLALTLDAHGSVTRGRSANGGGQRGVVVQPVAGNAPQVVLGEK